MREYPRTWADVHLDALSRNLARVRAAIGPEPRIALVAKADGYGHGLLPTARHVISTGSADWVAVATVSEGVALKEVGVDSPVLVLSPTLPVEAEQAVFYGLQVLIESLESAEAYSLAAQRTGRTATLHLKVDTGLSRFGCTPEEARDVALAISRLPGVRLVGLAQHFLAAYDEAHVRRQLAGYHHALRACREAGLEFQWLSVANGQGAVRWPEARGNLVRVGLLGFGMDPTNLFGGAIEPTMSWKARVTAIRERPEGTSVSYMATWTSKRLTRLATLGVGYGDGYPRALSNKGRVAFDSGTAPVVGLVCMDQTLVDVTDLPEVQVGDVAELLGPRVMAVDLARLIDTTAHEITTRVMSRVPRRYIRDLASR